MFTEYKRSDAQIQDAVKALFLGLAPEKSDDLERLWENYQLQFCLFTDEKGVMLEGGAYRYVHFNHCALRVIWVSAFAAWEAYACAQSAFGDGELRSFDRLQELLALALEIRDAKDPGSVPLGGLPEPGSIPSDLELRAPAELAMFAAGWAMLHEVRHLKHQQDFTATGDGDAPELARAEELSCDRFAADYLIATAAHYASAHAVDEAKIRMKRALGVYFGAFALIVLGHPNWEETESHPSVSDRLREIRSVLSAGRLDEALCVAGLALVGLKQIWADAPDFAS
ncbi:phage exclusion protein Lit family protein [Burkholderia pseudomallei]|uniref:phage exclusion protein Lit family protein n=1 Tax=Burkholderia pseudomallei TaxID=28450 RepID=UPI0018A7C0EA|nr:phage exclusion protein Lit family protein [Burkholderia pseudomallei]